MAALDTKWPTLLDLTKRLDPNGGIAEVAEILDEENEILQDMPFFEGNLETGHRHTIRTGLPEPTWRKYYGGVQPTKSTTAQVTDTTGMLEAYAEVDKALADLNGRTAAFRLSEDRPHISGIGKKLAKTIFYGNEGETPEAFTGFAPRFNSKSAANGDNILKAGGTTGNLTSIWLVVWGPQGAFGIYPKGSKAGLSSEDKGQVTIENVDGDGGRMEAYRTHYRQDAGLAVKDWRQVVRIANIAIQDLETLSNTKKVVEWMTEASEQVDNLSAGRPVFYMNRHIRKKLRLGILEKITNNLTWESVAGKRVMMFDDIPVKRCDAILPTESAVS